MGQAVVVQGVQGIQEVRVIEGQGRVLLGWQRLRGAAPIRKD